MDLGIGGRVALVTGGSRGIGKATDTALAREGARIAICARDRDVLESSAREIQQETGAETLGVPADVSRVEDVQRMVGETLDRFGRVDILVTSAASFRSAPLMDLLDEDW